MFSKKRKLPKYTFVHGKSPLYTKKLPKSNYAKTAFKRQNPAVARFKKILLLSAFLATAIFAIYLSYFSDYFLVTDIVIKNEVKEQKNLDKEIKLSINNALGKNIFSLDTETLQSAIFKKFPEIENLQIGKNYPNTIEIEFNQYPLAANIISESKTVKKQYIINSIGYIVAEDLEKTGLPYIIVKSDEPVNPKTPVIEKNKLTYILETVKYFEDRFGMRIIETEYKKIPRELHLKTEKDFYIWLDIQQSFEDQLSKLKKALVKLDIHNTQLQYIDLRIAGGNGDKIIYRRK